MINQETINQIFEAADIVDVISEFVTLKKSGTNFKGLSPFTNEKTPSFMVSPAKGIFKDFSSGKGGNAVVKLVVKDGVEYAMKIFEWTSKERANQIALTTAEVHTV